MWESNVTAPKLERIGGSIGVIIPEEALARMNLEAGDRVLLTEAPDGCRLTPCESDFEAEMAAARRIMTRRRDALRELAR